jgi:hypothetical protein
MLKFPNFTKPFEMHTTASGFTIKGVLMQTKYVITFERKKTNETPTKMANS